MPSCMARPYTLASVAPAVPRKPVRVSGPSPTRAPAPPGVGVRAVDAIELHEAEGALERIESWLRERGFFAPGGEDLVADLYLGYGLSVDDPATALAPPARAVSAPVRGLCRPAECARRRTDNSATDGSRFGRVAADVGRRLLRRGGRARSRRNRSRRRLPGQPRAAPFGELRRRPRHARRPAGTPEATPPQSPIAAATGRSCPLRRSCSSRDAAAASGRARSREHALRVAQPSYEAPRRTRPST